MEAYITPAGIWEFCTQRAVQVIALHTAAMMVAIFCLLYFFILLSSVDAVIAAALMVALALFALLVVVMLFSPSYIKNECMYVTGNCCLFPSFVVAI